MADPANLKRRPHSIEYFGDERDYFWNRDYLELLSRRLEMREIHTLADVGCGIGHWASLLSPLLAEDARIVGIDLEESHVRAYPERVGQYAGANQSAESRQANADDLPFDDGKFDAVTCQTLLLHLARPEAALAEMIRVTASGGLVLCVEPNNLIGRMPFGVSVQKEPIERTLRLSELAWRYARGRYALGKGSELIGEEVPGMFVRAGLENIQVWVCDKAATSLPPYSNPENVAAIEADERWQNEGIGPYEVEEFRENVLAGGGTEDFFEQAWADYFQRRQEIREASKAGAWSMAGGILFYIVAGRKPFNTTPPNDASGRTTGVRA